MTQLKYRVYKRGSRLPRDLMGIVMASSGAEACKLILDQPCNARLRKLEVILEAVPAHVRRLVGK